MRYKLIRTVANAFATAKSECVLCGEGYYDGTLPLCNKCFAKLAAASTAVCRHCGKTVSECTCNGVKAYSVMWYNSRSARRLVYELKHRANWTLVGFIAEIVVWTIKKYKIDRRIDAVAAVPSRQGDIRMKGYGHGEMLGHEIAAKLGLPFIDSLYRVDNKQQKLLSASQRRRDLKLRFKLDKARCISADGEPYRRVLLIDDIITTGGTMACCAALLRKGGATQVTNFTLTKAMKRK